MGGGFTVGVLFATTAGAVMVAVTLLLLGVVEVVAVDFDEADVVRRRIVDVNERLTIVPVAEPLVDAYRGVVVTVDVNE